MRAVMRNKDIIWSGLNICEYMCTTRPHVPLTLFLQEYRMCVARESARCPSGDGALLQTAIRHLVVGLQQQGHCAALNTQPEVPAADRHGECLSSSHWFNRLLVQEVNMTPKICFRPT